MTASPPSGPLCTTASLLADITALDLPPGKPVLLHTSLRRIGWVCGGAPAFLHAFLAALAPSRSTLVVPTQTSDNSDPAEWVAPPVPAAWWPVIREATPAYDPATTPTRGMGVVPEALRTWPGAVRSAHPQTSFAALGPDAAALMAGHAWACRLGDESPLAHLEAAGAQVVLVGVGFGSCTAFHLAEYRVPGRPMCRNGFAAATEQGRAWVEVEDVATDEDGFEEMGAAFEATGLVRKGKIGGAEVRCFDLAAAVRFAEGWLPVNRPVGGKEGGGGEGAGKDVEWRGGAEGGEERGGAERSGVAWSERGVGSG